MARRPNYSFERSQRDRAKVAKREAKREARKARKNGEDPEAVATASAAAAAEADLEPTASVQLSAAKPVITDSTRD